MVTSLAAAGARTRARIPGGRALGPRTSSGRPSARVLERTGMAGRSDRGRHPDWPSPLPYTSLGAAAYTPLKGGADTVAPRIPPPNTPGQDAQVTANPAGLPPRWAVRG